MIPVKDRGKIDYYYEYDRYIHLLVATGKWRDLYCSKEAILCCVITIIITLLANDIYQNTNINEFLGMIRGIIPVFIGGFLSLLGFLVAGLAVLANAINNKMIYMIDEESNFDALMDGLF